MTAPRNRIYNVGDSDKLTMADWVHELAKAAGWSGKIVVASKNCPPPNLTAQFNMDQHLAIDTTRIGQELGFREPVSREEALKRTAAWERLHPPQIDPKMFDYEAEDRILTELEQSAGS